MVCGLFPVFDRWRAVVTLCLLLCWTGFQPSRCQPAGSGADHPIRNFRICINANYTFEPTTWQRAVPQEQLPRLYLESIWQSTKPVQGPLTVVTHTSFNRLFQLRAQCNSWSGPLVATVHLPLLQPGSHIELTAGNIATVHTATRQLARFFHRAERTPRCQLTLLLLWELYSDPEALVLYPYNTLRNYALALASTELVAMLDVDLLPSSTLLPDLLSNNGLPESWSKDGDRTALILPAFETVPGSHGLSAEMAIANRAVDGGKPALASLVAAGLLRPFHQERYPAGHNCTDYPRWYTATQAYPIVPSSSYEPWFVLRRAAAPWYDERYRGYFYDKIVYVAALRAANYTFAVHPHAFTVHRPHALTPALQSPLLQELQVTMHSKYMGHLRSMKPRNALPTMQVAALREQAAAADRYTPRVDNSFLHCAADLPWFSGTRGGAAGGAASGGSTGGSVASASATSVAAASSSVASGSAASGGTVRSHQQLIARRMLRERQP